MKAVRSLTALMVCAGARSALPDVLFEPPELFVTGTSVASVEAVDLNDDGHSDLVVPSLGTEVVIVTGNGKGEFEILQVLQAGDFHLEQTVDDFNSDGHPDIALANFFSGNISVAVNRGDGTFASATDFLTPGVPTPRGIASADMDGDGDNDLVVGDGFGSAHVVMFNDGNAGFSETHMFNGGATALEVGLGDLNGDGSVDAVFSFTGTSVHLNHGDGTFQNPILFDNVDGTSVSLDDLDADGDLDIVVADSGVVHLLLNHGEGLTYDQSDLPIETLTRDVVVGDIDNDGDLDIVTSHVSDVNEVSVLVNLGNATFEPAVTFPANIYPQSVDLADFDSDGLLDIVVANEFENPPGVSLLLNMTGINCGPCEGDANADCTVDPLDSGFVLARLGCSVGTGDSDCDSADQNGDELVDPLDVGFVLSRFGPCE